MAIFALIVIALLLLVGYQSIKNLSVLSATVETKTFTVQFNKAVQEVYTEPPGSSREIHFSIPPGLMAVCFIDLHNDLPALPYQEIYDVADILKHNAQLDLNVFFVVSAGEKKPDPFAIKHLQPTQSFCTDIQNGQLSVVLENKGRSVSVTSV